MLLYAFWALEQSPPLPRKKFTYLTLINDQPGETEEYRIYVFT